MCAGHQEVPPPSALPPAGSAPVIYTFVLCFPKQGNASLIDAQTYLYYMPQSVDLVSLPSQNIWKPYNEAAEQIIIGDHKRLWATNFLDDLKIEVVDFPFSNGVIGKVIVYEMEERQRIKNTVYNEGTKAIEQAKVEERLRELGITIRLDSFVDQATEKKVANVIREMMVEKGFQEAKVEPYHEALPGGPKTIALKFKITEGPKIKISNVDFVGNKVFSDGKIRGKMKTNKGGGFWIFPGSSVYQEDKFEEDAEAVVAFYRDRGYLQINVGQPNLKPHSRLEGRQRAVHDPRDSDQRGRALPRRQVRVRRQRQGARRRHAAALQDEDRRLLQREADPRRIPENPGNLRRRRSLRNDAVPGVRPEGDKVNVTIRINEGKQYFINRITFEGNTTTRDSVIRRELRLYENSVYNTEALKYSVKRLNQLGYFKPLEDQKNITTEKTPGTDNKVDVTLKLEEQNRNQLSFGAGVSQYDGIFGQLSFSTANFMGRGETFTVSMQTGARVSDYQVAFTEPFLFDRPITGSVDLHRRDIEYLYQFTQGSTGGNLTMGFPMANFSRFYLNYSYDRVYVRDLNQAFFGSELSVHAGRLPDDRLRQAHGRAAPDYRVQPVPEGRAAHRAGRQAYDQQDHADVLAELDRQPDYPYLGPPVYGVAGLRGHRRQHEVHQSDARRHVVPASHVEDLPRSARAVGVHQVRSATRRCPSSSGWSLVADIAYAATICAASVPRTRTAASSSAATRACFSTPSI